MNQENKIEYFYGTNNLKYLSTYSKSLNKSIEIIMSDNDTINQLIIDGKILSIEDNKVSLKKDETIEGDDAFIINYLNNIIKIDTKDGFPYIQFLEKQNDLKNFQIHDPERYAYICLHDLKNNTLVYIQYTFDFKLESINIENREVHRFDMMYENEKCHSKSLYSSGCFNKSTKISYYNNIPQESISIRDYKNKFEEEVNFEKRKKSNYIPTEKDIQIDKILKESSIIEEQLINKFKEMFIENFKIPTFNTMLRLFKNEMNNNTENDLLESKQPKKRIKNKPF